MFDRAVVLDRPDLRTDSSWADDSDTHTVQEGKLKAMVCRDVTTIRDPFPPFATKSLIKALSALTMCF